MSDRESEHPLTDAESHKKEKKLKDFVKMVCSCFNIHISYVSALNKLHFSTA